MEVGHKSASWTAYNRPSAEPLPWKNEFDKPLPPIAKSITPFPSASPRDATPVPNVCVELIDPVKSPSSKLMDEDEETLPPWVMNKT